MSGVTKLLIISLVAGALLFLAIGDVVFGDEYDDLEVGLQSYWKLDESSGNASDAVGVVTLTNNGTVPYNSGYGKINNGTDYNGTDQYLYNASVAKTASISVSVWFFATDGNQGTVVGFEEAGDNRYWKLNVSDNGATGKLQIGMRSSSGNYKFWTTDNTFSYGAWHHFVVTQVGASTPIAYIDGSVSALTVIYDVGTYADWNGSVPFALGRRGATSSDYFDGYIDEVGLWNRPLLSSEVTLLYNDGAGDQYPFVAPATPTPTPTSTPDGDSSESLETGTFSYSWSCVSSGSLDSCTASGSFANFMSDTEDLLAVVGWSLVLFLFLFSAWFMYSVLASHHLTRG